MALRDRVAVVDSVRGSDDHLRAGVGKHGREISIGQLELRYELGESARTVLALALGEVQRLVRGGDELLRRQRVFWVSGDPDAESQGLARGGGDRGRMHGIDDAVGEP